VENGFLRMRTNEPGQINVHTANVGGYAVCSVPVSVDDTISSTGRTSKVNLNLPTVRSKINQDPSASAVGAEVLLEFHMKNTCPLKPPTFNVVGQGVRGYQWVKTLDEYEPEAKDSVIAFMLPLVDGAFAPKLTQTNEQRSIEKRVKELVDSTQVTPFLKRVVKEFVQEFAGQEAHSLIPTELSEVAERQNKPSQRAILERAENTAPDRRAKSFMKREAGPDVTDPRNITTVNGVDKRDYSTFTYALADHIKKFSWYAFGKTNAQLAHRVAEICEGAAFFVDSTDFSRMDGRVGAVARYLEETLCMYMFRPEYCDELRELMRSQHGLCGITRLGVKYDTGLSRLSGSPETSLFNTILNAFVAFLSFRMTKNKDGFLQPRSAWERLGVYGGDDGLTADANNKMYEKAAAMTGQLLTGERTMRGKQGISFLSRHYGPDVWFGEKTSCCDFKRALSKFHVTVNLPGNITKEDKLADKAYALGTTDANTPVVGVFVRKVLELFPKNDFRNLCGAWNIYQDEENQYPNEHKDWMDELLAAHIPTFDQKLFTQWIETANSETIFKPPILADKPEPTVKNGTVIIDDEVVTTETTTSDTASVNVPDKVTGRKRTRRGKRSSKPLSERPERKGQRPNRQRKQQNGVARAPARTT